MKIDRLLGIITVLLQKEKVTAPYLADKFEVSRRTISRDIEDICKAGIPLVTLQGSNGGITIADGYKIDKTIFTDQELRVILAGLCGLDSVIEDRTFQSITDKFFQDKANYLNVQNHILIDLSSHYKESLAPKIAVIQKGILARQKITFTYHNKNGENIISIDPYLIVFQWSSWYVFGFDNQKQDFRLFKLNRLLNLTLLDDTFNAQDIEQDKLNFNKYFTAEIAAVILFDPSVKYQLIDAYGEDCYGVMENGKLKFKFPFTNEDYLLSWVLSFGNKAELVEPTELKIKLKNILQETLSNY